MEALRFAVFYTLGASPVWNAVILEDWTGSEALALSWSWEGYTVFVNGKICLDEKN